MDNKVLEFKALREQYKNPVAAPLNNERSKFTVEDRKIKGYPIVWGSKNDYNEIVLKGATQNSLNARGVGTTKNPILVLNQHRQVQALAKPYILQEDDYGLYFEADIISNVQYADEALEQVRQGVLNQLSYGFNYIWDKVEYDATLDAYILKEIKLGEISLVTFSSDENAQLRSFNNLQEESFFSKFTTDQIEDLKDMLQVRAVTNTQETKEEIEEPKSNVTLF